MEQLNDYILDCNHHVKTKEKAAKRGFNIKYSHIKNGINNENKIR